MDVHMIARPVVALTMLVLAIPAVRLGAQTKVVRTAGGEVVGVARPDVARLATRIPGVDERQQQTVRVGGDSAQRIAMTDYGWRGRVMSVEIDEEDARVFWDVKILPDSGRSTVVRYRIDAVSGGILDVREFTGIRGISRTARKP